MARACIGARAGAILRYRLAATSDCVTGQQEPGYRSQRYRTTAAGGDADAVCAVRLRSQAQPAERQEAEMSSPALAGCIPPDRATCRSATRRWKEQFMADNWR
jgi:hypothetical protein